MSALGADVRGTGLDIGFLCQGWEPDVGGIETHTLALARGLAARGHRVHVLCLDGDAQRAPYSACNEVREGIGVRRLAYRYQDVRALADLVRRPAAEDAVLAWLAETPCDVVHAHHLTGFGAGALRAIAEMGRPLVLTVHDYWLLCPRGQLVRHDGGVCATPEAHVCAGCLTATWPHLMPAGGSERQAEGVGVHASAVSAVEARTRDALDLLALPTRLVAPSRAALDVLGRAAVDVSRARVIEHGLEARALAEAVAALRPQLPAAGRVRLGILGTVQPSKGVAELLEAFLEAAAPGLEVHVHGPLASYHGSEHYCGRVRALAARDTRIHLHGAYAAGELPRVLAGLDGVAAPARWPEVFGLTVREARAAGLPVLVSDQGALPEAAQAGAAGLVVPSEDRAAWRAALERFANDAPARAAWSAVPARLRTVAEMALEHERTYAEAVLALNGRLPALEHPIEGLGAAPAPPAAPRRGLLGRLFGR